MTAGSLLALAAEALGGDGSRTPRPVEVSGYVDALVVAGTDDARRQRPQALTAVRFDSSIRPGLRAHLELRGRIGGPFDPQHDDFDPHFYNLVHAFQQYSPALEVPEAWVDVTIGKLDARVGMQRFTWGRLDGVPPTDVLNPRDFHDPIVTDFEDGKIGIAAVQLVYEAPDIEWARVSQLRTTIVGVPFASPSRLPFQRERWFPESLVPGTIFVDNDTLDHRLQPQLKRLCDRKVVDKVYCMPRELHVIDDVRITPSLGTANQRPPLRFDAGGIGARVTATFGKIDWGIYHYTGAETQPNLALDASLTVTGPIQPEPTKPRELDLSKSHAHLTLRQAQSTVHMTGFDFSTSLGEATIRGEAAFFADRPYLRLASDLVSTENVRTNLKLKGGLVKQGLTSHCVAPDVCRGTAEVGTLFPKLDSVEWGIGLDYWLRGTFALLQLNQIVINEAAPRLIISNPETRFTAVVQRSFWANRIDAELRAVIAVDRGAWFVFPRVAYNLTNDLRARIGYLAIGGTKNSLIGQFKANDEVVFDLRWTL